MAINNMNNMMNNMNNNMNNKDDSTQLITDIQSLQNIEKEMFDNLETNTSLSNEQKQTILDKINAISNMRIQLYKSLNAFDQALQSNINQTSATLTDQKTAIDITEKNLNEMKIKMQKIEEERNNKIRLVEINSYYSQKYAEHTSAIKIIAILLICVIIITFLYKKELITGTIWTILIIIVSAIAAYFFWNTFIRMYKRNNMNYQEFDWYFNPSSVANISTTSSGGSGDPWLKVGGSLPGSCIGSYCCGDGLTYDTNNNVCVVSSATSNTMSNTTVNKETFKGLSRFLDYSKF